ncbi:hypothetical protein [Myceligenerans pegani]|uniref:Lipoprotein n=1 Tax=Myceligenerans pegani TaxID=2776917 RepID=A0ABR9MUJ3_9MICO|nr:hypothetical protein [Myceligenerans sp. TRM 65318]MBE1875054.1 hypothetical protein [Myceligenerans sp. TRM 65318]MBE3017325.1 hypothetical protein [Myceligenerans sp. TRM 65318]
MKIRTKITALSLAVLLPLLAACTTGTDDDATSTGSEAAVENVADSSEGGTTTEAAEASEGTPAGEAPEGMEGGPGMVDLESVTTEDAVISMIQSAYGDASLGLHRGHQPVEETLIEVLGITHDEMHVRMEEQGQNLASIATDLGIDPQTLIDALVDSWSAPIEDMVADGTITEEEGEEYLAALEEAFTFRVTWDGEEETPTFDGLVS